MANNEITRTHYIKKLEGDLKEFSDEFFDLLKVTSVSDDEQIEPKFRVTIGKLYDAKRGKDILKSLEWFKNAINALACFEYSLDDNNPNHNVAYQAGVQFFIEWGRDKNAVKRYVAYYKANVTVDRQSKIIAKIMQGETASSIEIDTGMDRKSIGKLKSKLGQQRQPTKKIKL